MLEPAPDVTEPPVVQSPAVLPIERAAAAFEVILCSGFPTQIVVITLLSAFGMKVHLPGGGLSPPFVFALATLDTVLVVGLVALFMRSHRESMRDHLFGRHIGRQELLLGLALIPISFVVVITVRLIVYLLMPSLRNVPHNPLQDLVHSRSDAVIFALVVMIAGGVREEIQRGFVLRRFEQYLGGGMAGLFLFSALFGLGHLEQGRDIAVATGVLGGFWGAIFLARRSIVGPMIGHAGFNLVQVIIFLTMGT